jgi:D-alanyl-lipoteichoic acid acyltransferase DltB (MBOAT superfamily)
MLFNSYELLFAFLPVTWIGYEILRRYTPPRAAMVWVVGASAAFYASWNAKILLVPSASIVVNFLIGRRLGDDAAARIC